MRLDISLVASVLVAVSTPVVTAQGLATGSQYVGIDLGANDGNFTVIWEGNRLLGQGTVDSFTYYSRTTDPLRPLILQQTGPTTFNVLAIGQSYTPSAVGTQHNVPFVPVTGTSAYNTNTGGGNYYFAFSAVGSGPLPVAYNLNPLATQEGLQFGYHLLPTVSTGPISFNYLGPASARHYEMTVNTSRTGVQETVGLELANRAWVDGPGYTFARTDVGFTQAGRVSTWSGFADVDDSRTITPLILRNIGTTDAPDYRIQGIGAARTFDTRDFFDVDFNLVSGTDIVQAGDVIGWWDSANAGGVVPYNLNFLSPQSTPTAAIRYFATGGSQLSFGDTLGAGALDSRSYSIAFQTVAIPAPTAATLMGLTSLGLLRRRRSVNRE